MPESIVLTLLFWEMLSAVVCYYWLIDFTMYAFNVRSYYFVEDSSVTYITFVHLKSFSGILLTITNGEMSYNTRTINYVVFNQFGFKQHYGIAVSAYTNNV